MNVPFEFLFGAAVILFFIAAFGLEIHSENLVRGRDAESELFARKFLSRPGDQEYGISVEAEGRKDNPLLPKAGIKDRGDSYPKLTWVRTRSRFPRRRRYTALGSEYLARARHHLFRVSPPYAHRSWPTAKAAPQGKLQRGEG